MEVNGATVTLDWQGEADLYRANHAGVDETDTLISENDSSGSYDDTPGAGTWYYAALIGGVWTNEVSASLPYDLSGSAAFSVTASFAPTTTKRAQASASFVVTAVNSPFSVTTARPCGP